MTTTAPSQFELVFILSSLLFFSNTSFIDYQGDNGNSLGLDSLIHYAGANHRFSYMVSEMPASPPLGDVEMGDGYENSSASTSKNSGEIYTKLTPGIGRTTWSGGGLGFHWERVVKLSVHFWGINPPTPAFGFLALVYRIGNQVSSGTVKPHHWRGKIKVGTKEPVRMFSWGPA
jgi:hypothetical protein